MAFDYKKEFPQLYRPSMKPGIVTVPSLNFVAVRGKGDPNETDGAYQSALNALYGIAYTIKMSPKSDHALEGYFEYVMPPLEGLWWQDGLHGIDYARKEDFNWVAMIRLPEFVTPAVLDWAKQEAERKKKQDFSKAEFFAYDEGLCVQCMHIGSYDNEPATVTRMHEFAETEGYRLDFSDARLHHELYLNDPRRTAPDKLKTIVRHPIAHNSTAALISA